MKNNNFKEIAREVIQTEIDSLKMLKKSINNNFSKAVEKILNCKNGKIIFSGVGKSGLIAKKISSTLSSIGTPSFYLDANSCSHGDLGTISSGDVLILISLSGESTELKNLIQYANRNKKIDLIGITSKKNSILYKNSDVNILLPDVIEAGPGNFVPTSSTLIQLSIGDALAIATMMSKKIGKKQFKKFHPSGSLGQKLKTVDDLMFSGNKIPFINENIKIQIALKTMTQKKLGILIARDSKKNTRGVITDGQLRRVASKKYDFRLLRVKDVMTKNPVSINREALASKALTVMNEKKITSLCVHNLTKTSKTVGIIHVHQILNSNIQ